MKGAGQKPRNFGQTIKRILSYMGKYRIQLVFVVVCIIVSAGAGVAGNYFLKPIINDYIVPYVGRENPDLSGFISLLITLAAIYLAGVLSTFIYSRLMVNISTGVLKNVRTDLFNRLQDLPVKYHDKHTHGELMSRFTNDTDAMREMISQSIPNLISSLITIVGVFVMMLILSPLLTLMIVVMLIIMMFAVRFIGSRSGKLFVRQQEQLGVVNGYIEEMTEGQKVVKVFCHEERSKERFDEINGELFKAASGAHTFANILMPIMGNLGYLNYALTAAVGGVLAINGLGGLDLGTLGSFLTYSRNFTMPITQISQQMNNILMALAGAERVFDLIDQQPEIDEGYVCLVNARRGAGGEIEESRKRTGLWAWKHPHSDGTVTYTELKGDIRFEDVTFGYEENKTVLQNISLYAKPGQKIALVGSTGAGKTTITNLVNRFYDVPDGKIRYDGININKIKKPDLRRSIAMVLQDTHLFTGTVMENIRYGKLDASDEECVAAARLANADSFIRHLPDGYNTLLTADGANLSQGQRQLLNIARAAVADPPVLVLDEATSSIDTRTEAMIEKGMDKLMQGRTVFVIAHRLSTVRNSDAIMVMEHGQIIERGNHDALIALKGKYYQLYTGMFELS
ncbi:MAG: ABC transporter ATP-binding protein [Clostridia bacterium]|nr:ABC transporter ATP-binding protein [Clostridia bacterium]